MNEGYNPGLLVELREGSGYLEWLGFVQVVGIDLVEMMVSQEEVMERDGDMEEEEEKKEEGENIY